MNVLTGVDALLISHPINIRYLTGFMGVSPEERDAFVLLTQNQLFLFTNSLYIEAARKLSNNPISQLSNNPIKIVEISRENPLSKKLAITLKENKIKRLEFEEADLTVVEYKKLKATLKKVALIPIQNRIEDIRKIKREDEIENIRSAAKLTDACFDWIIGKIKPGVTEGQISWEIESFFRKHGAQNAFSPIVAFGKNSSQPHYQTSDIKLKTSDIILLDFGARVNGYCSDMTRVVFVGEPNNEWKRAYEVVLQANHLATSELDDMFTSLYMTKKPVIDNGAPLDRWIRDDIKKAGYLPYPHSLGHGVGLDIHEYPRLTYKHDSKLLPGMVITIEPGIYVEGCYGIRIEDLVLLKKDGIEILSRSSKKLTIL